MGSPDTDIFYDKKRALKNFTNSLQLDLENTEKEFQSSVLEIFYWYKIEETGFVDIADFYTTVDLKHLQYRMAIRIPNFIQSKDIEPVIREKASNGNIYTDEFELFTYTAGKCVQILHQGPFADELDTLPKLQQFATNNDLISTGMHHEIHLTNFEFGQGQENLQTILRHTVKNK